MLAAEGAFGVGAEYGGSGSGDGKTDPARTSAAEGEDPAVALPGAAAS